MKYIGDDNVMVAVGKIVAYAKNTDTVTDVWVEGMTQPFPIQHPFEEVQTAITELNRLI